MNLLKGKFALNERAGAAVVERLASVVEFSDDAFIAHAFDGTILSWNRGAERIYGFSAYEAVGRQLQIILPPENLNALEKLYRAARNGKPVEKTATQAQRKSGRRIDISLDIAPVTDTSGAVVALISISRETRSRVSDGSALRESEERYRAFVVNSSEGIWRFELSEPIPVTLDEDEQIALCHQLGFMAECNDAMARMYGHARAEDMIGARTADLIPDPDKSSELFRAFIRSSYSLVDVETEELAVTGEMRRFTNNMIGIIEEGRLCRIWGTQHDITERKRAERALAEANRRAITEYEGLVERIALLGQALGAARDLTTVFRAVHEFAISSAPSNGIFVSLLDEARAERRAVFACSDGVEIDVKHLPVMPMSESPHSRAIKTGLMIIEDDLQAALKDQPSCPLGMEIDPRPPRASLIVPMSVMGRVIGAIELQSVEPAAFTRTHATAMRMAANLAAAAIENLRLLEQESESAEKFRQAQKMEAVGRLAGGVAHDFNNLLTVINGYTDLSVRRVEQHSAIHRNLEEIRKAGERASSLTRQLLAFSRQQVLQPRVLNLNAVVRDMEKMLRRLIGEDVELMTRLEEDLFSVKADPGQLEQVVLNLGINARDAMPKGGKLTITTANIYLDEQYADTHITVQPGVYVQLTVSDNGCGMTREVQKNIFEPFFTTKELGKGTGLGLSTVYGIVKQSGGNIWVYSELGQGTTFKIYLPVVEEETVETDNRAQESYHPHGVETILLVEDDDMVRRMTREVLEISGYTVLEAATGGEAVRFCEHHAESIQLLLTDVVMPQLSGKELADGLTLVRPEMKVLFMSGYTDEAIVHHGVLKEGTAFIQKPFTSSALARKVREILDAGRETGSA